MDLDNYYKKNINVLNQFCEKYNLQEDYISDTYIKLKKTLTNSGLTEQDYFRIIRRSVWNRFIDDTRNKYNRVMVNLVDDDTHRNQIEKSLRDRDEWDADGKLYAWEMEYLSRMLFQYIESTGNYSDIEVFIFKTYAINGYTYTEIHDKFGISVDVGKKIMQKFRKDLRQNFIKFVDGKSK